MIFGWLLDDMADMGWHTTLYIIGNPVLQYQEMWYRVLNTAHLEKPWSTSLLYLFGPYNGNSSPNRPTSTLFFAESDRVWVFVWKYKNIASKFDASSLYFPFELPFEGYTMVYPISTAPRWGRKSHQIQDGNPWEESPKSQEVNMGRWPNDPNPNPCFFLSQFTGHKKGNCGSKSPPNTLQFLWTVSWTPPWNCLSRWILER